MVPAVWTNHVRQFHFFTFGTSRKVGQGQLNVSSSLAGSGTSMLFLWKRCHCEVILTQRAVRSQDCQFGATNVVASAIFRRAGRLSISLISSRAASREALISS